MWGGVGRRRREALEGVEAKTLADSVAHPQLVPVAPEADARHTLAVLLFSRTSLCQGSGKRTWGEKGGEEEGGGGGSRSKMHVCVCVLGG